MEQNIQILVSETCHLFVAAKVFVISVLPSGLWEGTSLLFFTDQRKMESQGFRSATVCQGLNVRFWFRRTCLRVGVTSCRFAALTGQHTYRRPVLGLICCGGRHIPRCCSLTTACQKKQDLEYYQSYAIRFKTPSHLSSPNFTCSFPNFHLCA